VCKRVVWSRSRHPPYFKIEVKVKLVAALLLASSCVIGAESFEVKKLSSREIRSLEQAEKEFEQAKVFLESVRKTIKEAHGQTTAAYYNSVQNIVTCGDVTTVEIRGHYALITTETSRCVLGGYSSWGGK
jgi:hypothetical protein